MLTPVDITNRVFKGGIGYDKKDVEAFMLELSTDYRELYSSNVELKDKITTLNESLQHYRSIEDSMQKALTLSEKTAEETLDAAHDRARQINTEAELKAEALLADARTELQETKDEIYRLQQQYELFKSQFTKILDAQKKLMDGEMVDIDLGPNFEPSNPGFGNYSGGGLGSEGGLGAGTYTGSNDPGRERTNQDPAFDRGSLNMDPFADAANGGGRFSRQTGGVYTGAKKKGKSATANNTNSGLNMKDSTAKSPKVKRNVTATAVPPVKEQVAQDVPPTPQVEPAPTQNIQPTPAPNIQPEPTVTKTVSREEVLEAIKAAAEAAEYENYVDAPDNTDDNIVNGEVENKVNESHMIDSEDNYSEGFDFVTEDTTTQFSYEPTNTTSAEDTYTGEVENKVNESNMIDSEDNYSEGFDFVVDESTEDEIPTILSSVDLNSFNSNAADDNVLSGDVEDKINQSNLIGNDDDNDEGFSFL